MKPAFIIIVFITLNTVQAQRIAFWNVENFFDCINDSTKNDDDFTPFGIKAWGRKKYDAKCIALYKVIAAINAEKPLFALGLAEVENSRVLRDLCKGTPLRFLNFDFIHHEGSDPRGIDVAFLYRPEFLQVASSHSISIDNVPHTRDILYIKAIATDTLHIFICHFPSKFGGALETEIKRYYAGRTLRHCIDTILATNNNARIIAMGDFNGEPDEKPLYESIGYDYNNPNSPITNLMLPYVNKQGSHKYREKWSIIDHIIITKNFLPNKAYIFDRPFLLIPDKNYMGQKVFRTYNGPRYLRGYSDHLPVYFNF